jgi:hypothetical protein
MQDIQHIENMPAAARTALGMSDDEILAVEVGGVQIGSAGKKMDFRERHKPLLAPHGIADDRCSFDGRKHQAEVDPAALQRPD